MFDQLQQLPGVVARLQERVAELEDRLVVAERRPLTVAQAAEALGVAQRTIRRRIRAGTIQHRRTGRRVAVYLSPKLVDT